MTAVRLLGVILAGGRSLRMGGRDKFLLEVNGKTLLENTIDLASRQTPELLVCANGDLTRLPQLDYPIIKDHIGHYGGPLAGVITAMEWIEKNSKPYDWIATFPCDSADFPRDWVARCLNKTSEQQSLFSWVGTGDNNHYTYATWSLKLLPTLIDRFNDGDRSLRSTAEHFPNAKIRYEQPEAINNINTPEEWESYSKR